MALKKFSLHSSGIEFLNIDKAFINSIEISLLKLLLNSLSGSLLILLVFSRFCILDSILKELLLLMEWFFKVFCVVILFSFNKEKES
jgi:hypothetical protein